MVKILLKYFVHSKYDLYTLKLLLQLVVETSSLWHFMFRKLALIHGTASAQGSDPVWIEIR
jgi:hypothetical protein